MSQDLIANLANAFEPVPLPAGSDLYVDLTEFRADANIYRDLGKKIIQSPQNKHTYQLYAGHRGGGKSTELLRLKKYLEDNNCFVVYFAADQEDIDPEDAQYTDILIACTRHLLEELKEANSTPLKNWLKERWQDLIDLSLTKIEIGETTLETGDLIKYFGKLSVAIRGIPSERQKIREKINPHTATLLDALNEFIDNEKKPLPKDQNLVMLVDNLDRIVPIMRGEDKNNHDEIFLDRAEQLKKLKCHIVYTIPISMVYSNRANDLRESYDGDLMVLPMIRVYDVDNNPYDPGIKKIQEIISKRIEEFAPDKNLESDIFESEELLDNLCLMTGGHVRNLMLLMDSAFNYIDDLPITKRAAQRAITQARDVYRRTVEHEQWPLLAKVHQTHQIQNDQEHRKLLFNRCVLQYSYYDDDEELISWYDVHPLILKISEFVEQLNS